jgi:serine/threonine-protein kinase
MTEEPAGADVEAPDGTPRAGELISNKYRIERLLAQGGMGVVMTARHEALDQRVAIKFLLPELCAHPDAVERFLREARAAAQLQSDHVVRVFDVARLDDGLPYL